MLQGSQEAGYSQAGARLLSAQRLPTQPPSLPAPSNAHGKEGSKEAEGFEGCAGFFPPGIFGGGRHGRGGGITPGEQQAGQQSAWPSWLLLPYCIHLYTSLALRTDPTDSWMSCHSYVHHVLCCCMLTEHSLGALVCCFCRRAEAALRSTVMPLFPACL